MDALEVGMKDTLEWEVTEKLCTARGDYQVFSTPPMTLLVERKRLRREPRIVSRREPLSPHDP